MTEFASIWAPHRILNEIRFPSNISLISLLITMIDAVVLIPWAIFIFVIILVVIKGVKVVHQGTFMIVEHFGEYNV